jgi:hypothetical protein
MLRLLNLRVLRNGTSDNAQVRFDVPSPTKKGAGVLLNHVNRPAYVLPNEKDPQNRTGPSTASPQQTQTKDNERQPVLRTPKS